MISLNKYPFKQPGLYKDTRTEHPRLVGHKNINSVLLKDFCSSVFSQTVHSATYAAKGSPGGSKFIEN